MKKPAAILGSVTGFVGIDARRLRETANPASARLANNVDLTTGKEFVTRPGFHWVMNLTAQTKGLYSLNGTLRTVGPSGQSIPAKTVGPVVVHNDVISNETQTTSKLITVSADSPKAYLTSGTWVSGDVGESITIKGDSGDQTFTISARSGNRITLDSDWLGNGGTFDFDAANTSHPNGVYLEFTQGSADATLFGDSWPSNVVGATITTLTGFSATVLAVAGDVVTLNKEWDSGDSPVTAFTASGIGEAYPTNTIKRVSAVESVGASASFGVYPYIAIERWIDPNDEAKGTVYEHHWITSEPDASGVPQPTLVKLPFSPGAALLKASGKLFAADDVNGVVRYSSTLNGPRDWVAEADAGYLPVLTHASGDRRIQGLGVYDDQMAVIFKDAVQLWVTDPAPYNMGLKRVLNGPGTESFDSVVNVLGDLFYFTGGGFRSLKTVVVTGKISEDDNIGGPIDDLTKTETVEPSVALWSQRRGQYICGFAANNQTRFYCFRYAPEQGVMGWTTWTVNKEIEYMVEHEGVIYCRQANNLFKFDEASDEDISESGVRTKISYDVTFNDFNGGNPYVRKRVDLIEVIQRGTSTFDCYLDPTTDSYVLNGPKISGTTVNIERIFVGALARCMGFRFFGTGSWRLSAFSLQYHRLPW